MRLIKLRIKNIASLKGDHEIDFSALQSQSSLFAITGETGAGKSTILNSIGLALYGKVYKTNINQNDLVTLGEKEGQIELIFQSKGKLYYAFWKARIRKQNGELYSTPQTPQREIYTIESENFTANKNILNIRAEDILGLDFEQFCKCIILNQGEFARFLMSSFTERKEILEKLYPGELFDSFSIELKKEKEEIEKNLKEIEIELHTIKGDGPSEETLKPLFKDLDKQHKKSESWLSIIETITYHFTSLENYHLKHSETKSKIDTVKTVLTKETTIHNEIVSLAQKSSEELATLKEEQSKKQERWQELLKIEEAYKINLESLKTLNTNFNKLEADVAENQKKLLTIDQAKARWLENDQTLKAQFQIPIDVLRNSASTFTEIVEVKTQLNLLDQDLEAQREKFKNLEDQGKQESAQIKDILKATSNYDQIKLELEKLAIKKIDDQNFIESNQRKRLRQEELVLLIESLNSEKHSAEEDIRIKEKAKTKLKEELIPIQATLKLHDLFVAIETCLDHANVSDKKECPVCQTYLGEKNILAFKESLQQLEVESLKSKEYKINQELLTLEAEAISKKKTLEQVGMQISSKNIELSSLASEISTKIPDLTELEIKIQNLQKEIWQKESLIKDKEKTELAIVKTRDAYAKLKTEIALKHEAVLVLVKKHDSLKDTVDYLKDKSLLPYNLLKDESKKLQSYLLHENTGKNITQEALFINTTIKNLVLNKDIAQQDHRSLNDKNSLLATKLEFELQGKSASELINDLQFKVKISSEKTSQLAKDAMSHELKLKDAQSRLYTLEELIKEIELQYAKELVILKGSVPDERSGISDELDLIITLFKDFNLGLSDSKDLFLPIKNLLVSQKESLKKETSELKMRFASAKARLDDWEKRQDRINLLNIKEQTLSQSLDRKARLYEVLGKDELRSFVLSLVEENLIIQTNIELQKLCQGRYEIIHQSRRMKMSPDFYILDKYREAGMRKVSTLSGGETFMVSLALALGLAEMTRGKADIDTLFIDEGFGTLDSDSLQDVLDMLKQIQTRGLMVGIISHVKELTQSLPVNLLVTKKQDGVSTVGLIFN